MRRASVNFTPVCSDVRWSFLFCLIIKSYYMVIIYWIFWIIFLLLFILAYCIASCKYKALANGYSAFPNIELAKENPKHRKKIPIKIWYIVVGFLFLWIPIANMFVSGIFLGSACPSSSNYEFLIPKENKIMNILAKIRNFLNRDIS